MANFVLIENNEIIEHHDILPKSWKHISGLNLSQNDEEFLNNLGWYTVNKTPLNINYDTQYIDGYEYTFVNNIVTELPVIKEHNISPAAPITTEQEFINALENLRIERDKRLRDCDWTQLADVQLLYGDEWKLNWATYRQALRDLPNQCISGSINIYDMVWPLIPNT